MSYSGQTASSSWSRAGNTQINAFIYTHTHTLGQLLLEKINTFVHFPQKKKRGDGQNVTDDFSSWHWAPSPAV